MLEFYSATVCHSNLVWKWWTSRHVISRLCHPVDYGPWQVTSCSKQYTNSYLLMILRVIHMGELACLQAGSRRWAQTDRQLYTRRRAPASQPYSLWGIMYLYVTLLSPHNMDYVLWGPSTGFQLALTDSDALREGLICLVYKGKQWLSLRG